MSQITYNNVVLDIIKTKEFRQETVYDTSNTDMLYMRFNVGVSAVVAYVPSSGAQINPANPGEYPTDAYVRIRHLLSTPRRDFSMTVNGRQLLGVGGPTGTTIDANNGPKPRVTSIVKLSENLFMVDWSVEVCLVECDGSTAPSDYLSLRWSQSVSYDRRWYATKRTTGTLIVNASLLTNPDSLRALVTPPIDDNFIRGAARYTLSEDGLRLSFEFEDKQQYVMPPDPAVKASGKVFVSTGQGRGAGSRYLSFQMKLEGSPNPGIGNKQQMITSALAIFRNIADAAGGIPSDNSNADNPGQFLFQGGVGCDLFDNTVELQLQVQLNSVGKTNGVNLNLDFLDQDLYVKPLPGPASVLAGTQVESYSAVAYDPSTTYSGIAPSLRGETVFVNLLAAAFQDNCLTIAAPTNTGAPDDDGDNSAMSNQAAASPSGDAPQSTIELVTGSANAAADGPLGELGATPNSNPDPFEDVDYFDDDLPGVFDSYKIVNTYVTRRHVVSLPTAGSTGLTAFPKLANDEVFLTCIWTAEKVGNPPELPPLEPADPNAVLLDYVIEPESVNATEDGSQLRYAFSGRYEYGFYDSAAVNVSSPIPPFLSAATSPIDPEYGDAEIVWGDGAEAEETPANA